MSVDKTIEADRDPSHPVIAAKLRRLLSGAQPRVLDLFSGCGGISLGFERAGFTISGSVEWDALAARSHAMNFHSGGGPAVLDAHARPRDITLLEPADLVQDLHLAGSSEDAFDVIVGGPPCQAYARVGRAKLRELAVHPEAFLQDPRQNLYLRYLDYVRDLRPLAVLMENVPDVLNQAGHNVAEETCEALADLGYVAGYTLLNAAFYGVPQMRERMFLIGYRAELGAQIRFPPATHWLDLPRGYIGSRQVALKSLESDLFSSISAYRDPPPASPALAPAVTARDAIQDLPPITIHLDGLMPRGARRFDQPIPYGAGVVGAYAGAMRGWPRHEAPEHLSDHVIRSLPRDYPIFRVMEPGDQYPQAYEHSLRLFEAELERRRRRGDGIVDGSEDWKTLRDSIVPPYDPGKFPNKWRKMEADLPARTLMAHLGKDSYSHIHYDGRQARTISVREAARLQSFPDGFVFSGTMNPAFRQIGNAVPPLLAAAIAREVMVALKGFIAPTDAHDPVEQMAVAAVAG